MRGEKSVMEYEYKLQLGSPPHARGKVQAKKVHGGWQGITPACAGKSMQLHQNYGGRKDHPRMRGEKTARG